MLPSTCPSPHNIIKLVKNVVRNSQTKLHIAVVTTTNTALSSNIRYLYYSHLGASYKFVLPTIKPPKAMDQTAEITNMSLYWFSFCAHHMFFGDFFNKVHFKCYQGIYPNKC